MPKITAIFCALLIAAIALVGCGGQAAPTPTLSLEPTATAAPTATPVPTATPTMPPTATSIPSPTPTATPAPGVSLTDELYRNDDLGLAWQRPDAQWEFVDASDLEGLFGTLIPLVTLTREDPELYVTLLTIDLASDQVQILANLMQIDPEQALAAIAAGMGDIGEQAEITALGPIPAIIVPVPAETGGVNYMWIVVRPQGVVYILAEGFEDAETAMAALEPLTFVTDKAMSELTPDEQRARLITQVESLRGLQTQDAVTIEYLGRDDLRAKLEAEAEKEMDPGEVQALDQMLKLLDLLPQDADLLQLMLDLQESQILGFYDPAAGTFYLVDSVRDEPMNPLDQATFVHEYVHALQDQYFDLSRITAEDSSANEDEKGALQSLGEGDASLLMAIWAASNLSVDELEQILTEATELDPDVLERTPPYLQGALTFPYEQGTLFVQNVLQTQGWEGIDEIWQNLPTSTEQILHPDKYGEDEPTAVELPSDLTNALGSGWSEPLRDVWGEADLLLLLQEALGDDAPAAAAGWDGSQYVFLSDGAGSGVFAIEIAWDSAAEASEGADALAQWLAASGFTGEDGMFAASDGRSAFLQSAGDRVYLAVGSEMADVEALLEALPW